MSTACDQRRAGGAIEVSPDVHWVGVLDHDIVTFDVVMTTEHGTTYNAYLVNADKKVLVDAVKDGFFEAFVDRIRQVTDPALIDYIVFNHTEPDHSGCLNRLLELAPNATVVASRQGIGYLREFLGRDFPHQVVKGGDTLDLGNRTLRFVSAPHLHWPDTMYTYLEEDRLLFTCDSFGCHYAHPAMLDDQVGDFSDAFKYYFDVILKPFSRFMLKGIEQVRALDVQGILPGHGPLLMSDWRKWVDLSEAYARRALEYPQQDYVFIPYVSAHHNTEAMAHAIARGLNQVGSFQAHVADIETMPQGELEEHMARCQAVVVGCPTINQNILLPVYKLFAAINPVRDKGKLCGAFGSYGWSGESAKIIPGTLEQLKLKMVGDGVFVRFAPDDAAVEACLAYGYSLGVRLRDKEAA
ncbi:MULTISPECIES: FprA family A-type flavoprotein [Ectothiorhodospira]|uniref:FprA family A-type flavoprotein n=1 Tax=Ectothiorhodospira TaxID=1051 RepID=UPI001EE98CCF|nr:MULTISPECIES: FprA family A-type flavoprotein [Ectothiorhodospira]MCG5495869.1 FprA family A-type flavoprotein [Ectothiorhodospira variabilis]MCG5498528.1 FprA family A-type flavoprotein [Ectothiorhodospira variabilis]MCG5505270.1 FprA family A-type flavoprotein [Ectothiorhodospira variabilis]MCG5508427.1 FprA family A-type flavoprotein [Ectothiorhodospira variabilis]MCG5525907.1 FprA family A-type flavoprotein [Ectothiorhodospira haloalkaliphila]